MFGIKKRFLAAVRSCRHSSFFSSFWWAGSRRRSLFCPPVLSALLILSLLVGAPSFAQNPNYRSGGPLVEPVELCPLDEDGVLNVGLDVRTVTHKVQVVDTSNNRIKTEDVTLRSFNLLDKNGPNKWKFCDGTNKPISNPMIPGPTFRLRRKAGSKQPGSKFQMTLSNNLKPPSSPNHACNTVRDYNLTPPPNAQGQCTIELFDEVKQTWPACFHEDNVTNFHYHGFHVSPQPHQDWVLLNLYPKGSTGVPDDDEGPYPSNKIANAVGSYQYDLDRLPDTQAEGTHWYHPHKHGATGLQVLNGMAGTFVIEGPFDDWLNGQYTNQGGLEDKVLVVQQIAEGIKFFGNALNGDPPKIDKKCDANRENCTCQAQIDFTTPTPSINGIINPEVLMAPGEIQRWRFIGATMQQSAQLAIGFDANFEIRQIAEDGVQFAKGNYVKQPLLDFHLFIEDKPDQVLTNYQLAPGNRADFLVKAPSNVDTRTCFVQTQTLIGNVSDTVRAAVKRRDRAAIRNLLSRLPEAMRKQQEQALASPPLLTVCVDPKLGKKSMAFPQADKWPALPDFLENIPPLPENKTTPIAFSMTRPNGAPTQPNQATNNFYIDKVQYCAECANQTMMLDMPEQWVITNDSSPQHPFHIHINPFQLVEQGSIIGGKQVPFDTYDPPIWQDVIALPSVDACWDIGYGPIWDNEKAQTKCPEFCARAATEYQLPQDSLIWNGNWVTTKTDEMSVCRCCTPKGGSNGYVKIRQKPTEFTGEFVIHCHILGHEDRGMMQNIQTRCPNGQYGQPQSDGSSECKEPYITAAKQCPEEYPTGATCAGS